MTSVRKTYTKESINYVAGLISFKRFMDLSLGFKNNSQNQPFLNESHDI